MTLSPPADQYFLSGTFNFRDTGGLRTHDGAKVRPGVLLRSAQLSGLDDAGHAGLRELGVSVVHDLRGQREIDHIGADRLPADVRLTITPFDSRMAEAPPHEATARTAYAHMLEVYRMFPALPEAHAAIASLAESILRGEGAVLVHCAAGKDRTGWAVATLLRAVGVIEADVQADYLLSNGAVPALRALMTTKLLAGEELSIDLLGVRDEYLDIATASMRELHGDLDGYLAAIGLTPALLARLRDRMLE
ncbi:MULTISPECIES: tyrosine-protein phosphatase [Nocardia]|uniref:Phosphotyrosine protein phosphatase n=1 Tax=Nocardia sputorum TaxID=2984338 RepID=A0ABN6TY40_9NOCA|nr:tyrosine-protein phosphatase [Nocardia sputorum]BDT97846.1 phosphotyrosine protein phosphatase [Nocardia sputorum]